MSYAEIVSEDGCFEVCYPKTRTRYGVYARSGLAATLGPDCVEFDGWLRSKYWAEWTDNYGHPRASGIRRRGEWHQ
jgi:hypothetical protein